MTDDEIERALDNCWDEHAANCYCCPYFDGSCYHGLHRDALRYVKRLKAQFKELLSALYRRTEKEFTLERNDIVELAKDYGIKEEDLK